MIEFKNDEDGYFAWLSAHPNGFVRNVKFDTDPDYVVLHRASCGTISKKAVKSGETHHFLHKQFNPGITKLIHEYNKSQMDTTQHK